MHKRILIFAVVLTIATTAFAQERRKTTFFIDAPFGKRAVIGAMLTSLTPELRQFFGAPSDQGVLVASVTENGPAAKAGIHVGDVITAVDGNPIGESMDIAQVMRGKHAGDSVRIDVIRNHNKQTVVATAEERDVREFRKTFTLDDMQEQLRGMDGPEWKALVATPDNEELRARIKALEQRLAELEKKLQQK
ncbi:MAG TPA: PDZ domain-containing protein [Thermoanaerobaculia bacterium]|nr:PDZ domain-containing protein [Thermoanaerobaculia bacterium]